jgi:hypothetical protein
LWSQTLQEAEIILSTIEEATMQRRESQLSGLRVRIDIQEGYPEDLVALDGTVTRRVRGIDGSSLSSGLRLFP